MFNRFVSIICTVCMLLSLSAFAESGIVYGTAPLTYAEFYAGDVSAVEGFDAVTSATAKKYSIFENAYTDYADEETNAGGYHILGVKNVYVAVSAQDAEAYIAINPGFAVCDNVPAQYKPVTVENGVAVYGATVWNTAAVVETAEAQLLTGTNWGDYQINVIETDTTYLRNTREDTGFAVGSGIMGIIVENDEGLRVGLEYLQNIWVMTYELSFNVSADSQRNSRISVHDNLSELSKLVGTNIVKITFITADAAYEYTFDGIYVKPAFGRAYTASIADSSIVFDSSDFKALANAHLTVTYTVGEGRDAVRYTVADMPITDGISAYALDLTEISALEAQGKYSFTISSDSYADITGEITAE